MTTILSSVRTVEWQTEDGNRPWLNVSLPARTAHVVLLAHGWDSKDDPSPSLNGCGLDLRWFDGLAIISHRFDTPVEGAVRFSASSVPERMTIRSSALRNYPSVIDAIFPGSLLVSPRVRSEEKEERKRRVTAYLCDGQIDLAMAETADAWLAGSATEGEAIASLIVTYLSEHPLIRPASICALLATFCMSRVSK